ncbi:alpha/beta fold hydrolase [Georgenia faecalis]|uniref:alpha/beta fold hydrolase n=1 Tax=Georgenia faecalis TaxID=2483799 RepID=UPI000FDCD41A|nr:alpha/beta hydrolase [Georgenia faecalis]
MPLHVAESGQPAAPSLVLLHGVGASSWMWWHQVAALGDLHCLAVDLPGHGRSAGVAWDSLAATADLVAEVIRERGAGGRAHVVGLSLGGHVALALLERHAAVLETVVVSGVTAAPWPGRALLPLYVRLAAAGRGPGPLAARARALGLPPAQQAAYVENALAMADDAYRRAYREVSAYRAPAALAAVPVPTLVLAGGRESRGITAAVRTLPALLPRAEGRVAPGLGHGWNVEDPELFTATVRAWVRGTPLPAALRR